MPLHRPTRWFATRLARPTLAICAITATIGGTIAPALATGVGDYCADTEEQTFVQLINAYREQNGLGPVALSQTLGATAEHHSNDMSANSYFSHSRLDGSGVSESLRAHEYTDGTYGENIAAGVESAAEAFAMWQTSPSHNANMLQGNFSAIGVGRSFQAGSGYGWYWTTVFGGQFDVAGATCGGRLAADLLNVSANASTTDRLNLRAGAGAESGILRILPNNARIQVIGSAQNGYYPVSYDGQTGWVLAEAILLDGDTESIFGAELVVNTVPVPDVVPGSGSVPVPDLPPVAAVDTDPGETNASTSVVPAPTTMTSSSTDGTLVVGPTDAASGTVQATQDLNLRGGPSRGDPILSVIPAGSPVTVSGAADQGYLAVTYGGMTGWADAAYLSVEQGVPASAEPVAASPAAAAAPMNAMPVTVATTLDALNFRAGPSADSVVLTVIPNGAPVSLTGEQSGGYLGITYGGQNGWADAAYLA